jgi:acyl CoA:acetate/3-ketoacid CoA transferase
LIKIGGAQAKKKVVKQVYRVMYDGRKEKNSDLKADYIAKKSGY